VDSPHHDGFLKENDPTLKNLSQKDGRDWFRIVDDASGNSFFLKTANKRAKPGHGLIEVQQLVAHQPEVYASRIAQYIGYPVLDTRPVEYDGKAWLASRFVENHLDVNAQEFPEDELSNKVEYQTRTIFNMLVGSVGDCSNQGIFEPELKKYWASDLTMYFYADETEMSFEQLKDKFERTFKGEKNDILEALPYFGSRPMLDEEQRQFVSSMLDRVRMMTPQDAKEMFRSGHGEFKDPVRVLHVLKRRAEVIREMFITHESAAN
jgi:hypothetical protein